MTTKSEYLDDFLVRAQRAGFTEAFINVADCVVGGKTPNFLVLPARIADRFQELHPDAQRLTLDELKTFVENKYREAQKASDERLGANTNGQT